MVIMILVEYYHCLGHIIKGRLNEHFIHANPTDKGMVLLFIYLSFFWNV